MDVFLVELMVVFVLAVLTGIVFRYFGLPALVGHVLAGFVMATLGVVSGPSVEMMRLLGSLGITLLLFLVGIEMNWQEIRKVGRMVLGLFLWQTIILVGIFAAGAYFWLHLGIVPAVLLGVALTFSSTIVVVKILSEKKELNSFVGKLSLGILLLQDLLAIIVLILIPNLNTGLQWSGMGSLFWKLLVLLTVINLVGHYFISWLMRSVIKSSEDLILFSLVWFMLAIFFSTNVLGLTPEIGGILAGLSLSTSWGHFQIVSKIKTLRDIFLMIFFVLLGFEVGLGKVDWGMVLLLVLFSIVIKFAVTHLSSRLIGLSGKVAFSVAVNVTQMSEFSLIVLSIGLVAGMWNEDFVRAITMAGLFSMSLSTILITQSGNLYRMAVRYFPSIFVFGGSNNIQRSALKDHVVLLGGDRTGKSILSFLSRNGENVLVVDFNPEVVTKLNNGGVEAIFADASDPDVVEITNMKEAKMVISTIKDLPDTLALLTEMEGKGIEIPVIADAETISQAKELYSAGAAYVIFPHFVSGSHLGSLMKKFGRDKKALERLREKQEETLKIVYEGEY